MQVMQPQQPLHIGHVPHVLPHGEKLLDTQLASPVR
jgi:hypothetical protein